MTLYFALSGQSNARGRGTDGDFTISPLVKVWNNKNDISDLTYLGDAWVTPDRNADPFVSGGNNLGVHAANQIALATGEEVRLVIVAKASQGIAQWYSANMRQPMLLRMLAILELAGVTSLDGFWWHQGEADHGTILNDYRNRWNAMVNVLQNQEGLISATTPIVMGEVAVKFTNSNANLGVLAAADPRIRLAPIKNTPTISDDTHFPGPEYVRIGLVYAGLQQLIASGV